MKKLTLALIIAGGIAGLYTAPAFAASNPVASACTVCGGPKIPNPGNPGNPGGDPGNEPTSPGDPFIPGNPGGDNPGDNPGDEPGDNPGDNPGNPGGDPGMPGDNPGNPNNPGNPGNPGNPNNPGNPELQKQAAAEMKACLARLDDLPQVSAEQIDQFGNPHKVSLKPICETNSLTEVGETFIATGNVYGLEPVLKSNELIRSKLGQSAYKARDVVGIDFDDKGNAILLVHKLRG